MMSLSMVSVEWEEMLYNLLLLVKEVAHHSVVILSSIVKEVACHSVVILSSIAKLRFCFKEIYQRLIETFRLE